jgi:hypothetical protein
MRISQDALDACEPLFQSFVQEMGVINEFDRDLFDALSPQKSLFCETLRVLNQYGADRCRGAYCLLVNGLVWDAEIVIRTFYEVIAKSLFLATASLERRKILLEEYWEVLPAISDAKGAERAQPPEKLARREGNADDERVFAHFRNPRIFTLEQIGNRKFRSEVEQRWSFSGIIAKLNKPDGDHERIGPIDTLLHGYGMASHLAHANPKAMDLMEDRATRGSDLPLLESSHVARMLSDMLYLSAFSTHRIQVAALVDAPMSKVLIESLDRFSEISKPVKELFSRSQDDFYNEYNNEDGLSL